MVNNQDHVDSILEQWSRERPDLDASPMGITGRLSRLAVHRTAAYKAFMAEHGLQFSEFDVLATLRRSGAPYTLTAGALATSMMLSGGAITNRIDNLVKRGLVDRREDPDNRRSVLISLTPAGFQKIDDLMPAYESFQKSLLTSLSQDEQEQLANLMRKWLLSFEG